MHVVLSGVTDKVFLSRSVSVEALSVCLRWKECSGSKRTARNPGRSATSCYEPLGYITCQRVKPRSVAFLRISLLWSYSLFSFTHSMTDTNTFIHLLTDLHCYTMALFLTDIKTHFLIWSQRVQYVRTSEGVWPRHVCKITFLQALPKQECMR